MKKKIFTYILASSGFGLIAKYISVIGVLIFGLQNFSDANFLTQFHNAVKIVSPYNVLIFSFAFCIIALLYFIDWKRNKGEYSSGASSWF